MVKEKICSFFGHEKIVITDKLRVVLKNKIKELIEKGFNVFHFLYIIMF